MFNIKDFYYRPQTKLGAMFLPPPNEVWGKVIFSQACVKNSVHRAQGGAWSRGGVETPPGWLLLRVVRILLECILITPVCHSVHGGGRTGCFPACITGQMTRGGLHPGEGSASGGSAFRGGGLYPGWWGVCISWSKLVP